MKAYGYECVRNCPRCHLQYRSRTENASCPSRKARSLLHTAQFVMVCTSFVNRFLLYRARCITSFFRSIRRESRLLCGFFAKEELLFAVIAGLFRFVLLLRRDSKIPKVLLCVRRRIYCFGGVLKHGASAVSAIE